MPSVSQTDSHSAGLGRSITRVVLVVLVLSLGAFIGWRVNLTRHANDRLAAIAREGHPTNPAELEQWYAPVPDADNAALLYQEAFRRMKDDGGAIDAALKELSLTEPLGEELRRRLESHIDENSEAIEWLIKAAALDRCRYPIDLSKAFLSEWPHLADIKNGAQLLRRRAILAAVSGDAETATESAMAALALSNSLAQEPILLSHLVRLAANSLVCEGLQRVVNHVELTEAQLERLIAELFRAETSGHFARALIGERAVMVKHFRMTAHDFAQDANDIDPEESLQPAIADSASSAFLRATGLLERDLRFFLDSMATNIAIARLPSPRGLTLSATVQQQGERARRNNYFLSGVFLPALSKAAARTAQDGANLRVAATALAIEQYRLAHNGRLPESLADLVPEHRPSIPGDPFDGQPLRYQKREKGYLVYSVGPDGKDEGGADLRRARSDATGDIAFTVERHWSYK